MTFLQKNLFYTSVFGGLVVWFFIFLVTPAYVVQSIELETVGFIIANISALVFGYVIFPEKKIKTENTSYISSKYIFGIIILVVISFFIRYIDLFAFRGLKISNSIAENRRLAAEVKPNLLFIIASVFKQLYFVPIILYLSNKRQNRLLLYLSVLLFCLPFLEAILRGSRSVFFFAFIFLILILGYFNKLTFSKKQISIAVVFIVVLFSFTTSLFMKREVSEKKLTYKRIITEPIFNDVFRVNEATTDAISKIKNPSLQKFAISSLQFGQYYTHGVFEFNHLVKYYQQNDLKTQKGKFIFFTLVKFTNRFKLTDVDIYKLQKTHPRFYTFITFFGGLFLDFGWFSLLIMCCLGLFQKFFYNEISTQNAEYIPLFLLLMFNNFFMLTFNFMRGQATYSLLVCLFIIIASKLFKKESI